MRTKLSHAKWTCHVTSVKWTKFDRKFQFKNTILGTKFCPFYTGHMTSPFCMGQLCTHLACEDVRAKFSFEFFRKVLELFFAPSKKGSKCSQEPKLPSRFSQSIHVFAKNKTKFKIYGIQLTIRTPTQKLHPSTILVITRPL